MKYKFPKRKIKTLPKAGDVRKRNKFLIFPKYINREVRWLCLASYVERYEIIRYGMYCDLYGWKGVSWEDEM